MSSVSATEEAEANGTPKAVPLIQIEDDETFQVNPEAVALLKAIEGPVAVIAICGLYRTGKSSLLNWLLDRPSGFAVGPTVERCTRGLWIWDQPEKVTLSTGEEVSVLMLDSEGIGGIEADSQYDARIFSLGVLLCSTLVYNSLGSIDETAISSLSFVANLTKHIRITADQSPDAASKEAADFHQFFPSFTWVVRDFALELVDDDDEPITSSEYLERSLAPQPGFDKPTRERNRTRQMLTAFFSQRGCVTLVRPLLDESQLQQVDNLPIESLRPEFTEALDELKDELFTNLRPKTLEGRTINGAMYAGLVEAFVAAINEDGVPTISTAWDGVSLQECKDAAEGALSDYTEALSQLCGASQEKLPVDDQLLNKTHASASRAALTLYSVRAVGEGTVRHKEELTHNIEKAYSTARTANMESSITFCESCLRKQFQATMYDKLHGAEDQSKGLYDKLPQVEADWATVRANYEKEARGPAKAQVLADFAEEKWSEAARVLLTRHAAASEEKINGQELKMAELRRSFSVLEEEAGALKKVASRTQQDNEGLLSTKATLESRTGQQEERLAKATEELQSLRTSLDEVEASLMAAQSELGTEKESKAVLLTQLDNLAPDLQALRAQLGKEKQARVAAEARALKAEAEVQQLERDKDGFALGDAGGCCTPM